MRDLRVEKLVAPTTATLFCVLSLTLILDHHRPNWAYNLYIAHSVLLAASTLSLGLLFTSNRVSLTPTWKWLLPAMVASSIISTIAAPNDELAFNRLQLYYACIFIGITFYLVIRSDPTAALATLCIGIGVVHAALLVIFFFSMLTEVRYSANTNSIVPYFSNIRHFGYIGFLAACAGVACALLNRHLRLLGYLLSGAGLFGLFFLGSRGPILAWGIFVAVIVVLSPARLRTIALCVGLATLAAFAAAFAKSALDLGPMPESIFDRASEGGSLLRTHDRLSVWAQSISHFFSHPVFGLGPDGHHAIRAFPGTVQPHNALVQFLVEFGIVGTSLILIAAFKLFSPLFTHAAQNLRAREPIPPAIASITGLIAGFLAYSVVDGLLYHGIPLLYFAGLSAIAAALSGRK